MTEAVEALGALPSVQTYNSTLGDPLRELHVHTNTLHVEWAWRVHTHPRKRQVVRPLIADAAAHAAIIPDLLHWTSSHDTTSCFFLVRARPHIYEGKGLGNDFFLSRKMLTRGFMCKKLLTKIEVFLFWKMLTYEAQ